MLPFNPPKGGIKCNYAVFCQQNWTSDESNLLQFLCECTVSHKTKYLVTIIRVQHDYEQATSSCHSCNSANSAFQCWQMSSKLQSDVCYLGRGGAIWGECLRGEGLVWLVGAVVCLLAAPWVQLSVSAGNGWPHTALQHHQFLPISCWHFRDCKARRSGYRVGSAIYESDLYFYNTNIKSLNY